MDKLAAFTRQHLRLAWSVPAVLAACACALAFSGGSGASTPTSTLPLLPINDLQPALGYVIGGVTPPQAKLQDPAQPSLTATPSAPCQSDSHPLAGVEGRVPASALFSAQGRKGFTCNLSLVSHYGSSGGYKVWRYIDQEGHVCAFYDTALLYPINAISLTGPASTGVVVLNMKNPAHPVQTDTLTTVPMLSPHESLFLNYKRGLLAADMGNPGTYPGLMSIYSVKHDCLHPTLDSTYLGARFGHESGFSPNGDTFWITGAVEGLAAVDVTNPKKPHTIGQWNEFVHGLAISDNGNTAYAADPVNGELTILNISQVQRRVPNPKISEISRLTWNTVSIPQNSDPIQINRQHYLLEFDEFGFRFNAGAGAVGAARIININKPAHPRVISNIRLAINNKQYRNLAFLDPQPLSLPLLGYSGHYCAVPKEIDPVIIACTFTNSGLRIFNIQNPYHPRQVAYFIAPAKQALANGLSGSNFALSEPAFDPATREVWYTDAVGGLFVLKLNKSIWPHPDVNALPPPGN
jgi:hypothetical protein